MKSREWETGLSSLGSRIRFRFIMLRYFMQHVKSLYLFVLLLLCGFIVIVCTLLPSPSPFSLIKVKQTITPREDDLASWKYFHNNLLNTIWQDSLYTIDYRQNALNVARITGNKAILQRRILMHGTEITSSIRLSGDYRHPLFYTYTESDSLRIEYAYDPVDNKYFKLYEYNRFLASYNLDGEGIIQSIVPYIVYNNSIYYPVIRYGFEEKVPSRGLWKLDLGSGKRKQLLAIASFPEYMVHQRIGEKDILITSFGATNNGASWQDTDDSHAYIIAYDLKTDKELWRKTFGNVINMKPLCVPIKEVKPYRNRYIFSCQNFSDYNPEHTLVTELDPLDGNILSQHVGLDLYLQKEELLRWLDKDKTLEFLKPIYLLTPEFERKCVDRGWGKVADLKLDFISVFTMKDRVFLFLRHQNDKAFSVELVDSEGNEFLHIPQSNYAKGVKSIIPLQADYQTYSKSDGIYLVIRYISAGILGTSTYILKPRPAFGLMTWVYQSVQFLKHRKGTTLSMMILIMLITSALAMLTLNRQYQSFKQMASFFTAPDLVLKSKDEISEQLRARVESSTILVVRIMHFNKLISAGNSIQAQSNLMDRIMRCLANTCFRKDVVIDKYLNEGIMLLIRGSERKQSVIKAIDMSRQIKKNMESLSLKLDTKEKLAIAFGLSYGENLVGLFGSQTKKDFTCVGKYVNLAFRMAYALPVAGLATHQEAVEGLELDIRPIRLRLKGFEDNRDYLLITDE